MNQKYFGKWWKNAMRGKNCRTRFVYEGIINMELINPLEDYLQKRGFYIDQMFELKRNVENSGCVITYEHK